ncbi:hypothetical protein EV182_001657 [Spiromyces aspiralis]|uniref:Uncharacterized protein n=1 Tax=Spiromyces aspiralis TaxID=68401 RepID=A0ACC1HF91_9FUNG|nr:hypothetical protein EV182_001657 [Spiromyces aspiralis]
MSEPQRNGIEKCLQLLSQQSTDDEKFAGLLLLTRIVDPTDRQTLGQILDVMNFKFIVRLINTGLKHLPTALDKDQGSGEPLDSKIVSMVELAIYVTSTFASTGDLASHVKIVNTLPALSRLLLLRDQKLIEEAMRTLITIVSTSDGLKKACSEPMIVDNLVKALPLCNKENQQGIMYICDLIFSKGDAWLEEAASGATRPLITGYARLLRGLCELYQNDRGMTKIHILHSLLKTLPSMQERHGSELAAMEPNQTREAVQALMEGSMPLLQQKGNFGGFDSGDKKGLRIRESIIVISTSVIHMWPRVFFAVAKSSEQGVADDYKGKATHRARGSDDATALINKFPEVITRVAFIEGEVSVNTLMSLFIKLLPKDPTESARIEAFKKAEEELRDKKGYTPVYFINWFASALMSALAECSDQADAVEEQQYLKLMGSLRSHLMLLVEFLKDLSREIGSITLAVEGDKTVSNSVSLLVEWLISDTSAHRDAADLLPIIARIVGNR